MFVNHLLASRFEVNVLWRIERLHLTVFRRFAVREMSAPELDNNAPRLVGFFRDLLVAQGNTLISMTCQPGQE